MFFKGYVKFDPLVKKWRKCKQINYKFIRILMS